jgi:hypothetical protein
MAEMDGATMAEMDGASMAQMAQMDGASMAQMDGASMAQMDRAAMAEMNTLARVDGKTGRKKTKQLVHKADNVPVTTVTIPAFPVHHPFIRGRRYVHLALLVSARQGSIRPLTATREAILR